MSAVISAALESRKPWRDWLQKGRGHWLLIQTTRALSRSIFALDLVEDYSSAGLTLALCCVIVGTVETVWRLALRI